MAEAIVRQFKASEKTRKQNRKATRKYQQTEKGRIAQRRRNTNRYYGLKERGLCAACGMEPPRKDRVHCAKCAAAQWAGTQAFRRRAVSLGLCTNCGKNKCLPAMKNRFESFCERCYMKKTSTSCLRSAKYAEVLFTKLKQQKYRCAYTGEKLELGLNDSLDHILPISRFPHLRCDPDNVQWVTRRVNCLKWDSTPEEFLETARLIVSYNRRLF